ncbi:MAG TPA: ABC transporter ATP-binding protein [Acidimicrobiales bacterium]|nr:ABC transporter ATP-binding protein [Acidimicrobiales bacterium]
MTADAILEVQGLTVNFGGVVAVDDVNFTVKRGQILGVVGPNGAGKTTVFDAIGGFVPARGRVIIDGVDVSDRSPEGRAHARLGRSFQDARLFPSLTVFETLAIAFERHMRASGIVSSALGMPWVKRAEREVAAKADELIELTGLSAFRDKFVAELSTGSRRIVDLAVIMAHDPAVLLLDEPSSGIAQRETEALAPLLTRMRDESGVTILVVEHDMPLVRSISDEILALETGRVLTQGAPDDVLNDPRLVAAYLGTDSAVIHRSGTHVEIGTAKPKRRPAAKKKAAAKKAPAKKKAVAVKKAPVKKKAAVKKKAPVKQATPRK